MNTLKRLRVIKGLSQERLAEMSGVSRGTIQAVERGRRKNLSVPHAKKIAVVLDAEWPIFFGDDAVKPERVSHATQPD